MAEKPPAHDASPASSPKPAGSHPVGNPAFRMMGLPNIRLKLPSRNWLIFWTIIGSFTSTLLYDRYHKKRALQKWSNVVSHIAEESLPANTMPRRITIFLAAPPGDGLRVAREHFHEYIKPILVAGALDWEVIEGRREGEVRAGLAEKIRKLRKRKGERPNVDAGEQEAVDETPEHFTYEMRQRTGILDWDGVQGDLVLGRHTWKEYVRGLHEGWLGPLQEPQSPTQSAEGEIATASMSASDPPQADAPPVESIPENQTPTGPPNPQESPAKPTKPSPAPPYISPLEYPSASISPTADAAMTPSKPLPLPHLLGFFNTPIRVYRFLTRRRLADSTGRSVAALVMATHSRSFNQSAEYASAIDPDDNSPSANDTADEESVARSKESCWEQEATLRQEEQDWHKSVWKANEEGENRERVWQEPMIVDNRIAERMRLFELPSRVDEEAEQLDAQKRQEAEGVVEKVRRWTGWTIQEKKGWDMGLEGDDDNR